MNGSLCLDNPAAPNACFPICNALICSSMTLDEIKAAIVHLTIDQKAELAQCLHGWEDDEWDGQIRGDLKSGKLNKLLLTVDEDIASNSLRDLP